MRKLTKEELELRKKYCVDCKKELSITARYDNTLRCQSCAARERVSRPEITFSLPKFLDNNPNWNNGASFEPYTIEFTKKLKESIRIRDNYECQNCSMTEEEHLIVVGKVLTIHHIDYNKKNCDENNLVTVCSSCNIRANYNRDYWYTFYNKIIDLKMAKYEKGKVLINVRPKNF
jgi:hypothetical protein